MMKRRIAIGLIFCGASLFAADELPKAETILDKYVEATGGKAAYAKVHGDISTGTMTFTAMGLSGKLVSYSQAPDKRLVEITLEGIGRISEGVNGDLAWSTNAMQGPRIKEGEEKATTLLQARYNGDAQWRDVYKTAETVALEQVDGKDAYKVVLTPKAGRSVTKWYDKNSNFVLKIAMTTQSPMGEIAVESFMSDYRKEGDLMQPHKVLMKAAGQDLSMTIDKIEYNPEFPKDKFDPPAEVKALMNKPAK
jgi:zinc protease